MNLLAVVADRLTAEQLLLLAALIIVTLWVTRFLDEREPEPEPLRRMIGQEPKPR